MTTSAKNARPAEHLEGFTDQLSFGLSWVLILAVGLMPIAEASLDRAPSISIPAALAFLVAVGSAMLLRQRYTWVGLVLHIYGQIAIWLSLFAMSLAFVLFAFGAH